MVIGVGAALLAIVVGLWLFQRRLIYIPSGSVSAVATVLPGWEEVSLETVDGLKLAGWFRAPEGDAPVIIVFNGNAGNRSGRVPLGSQFEAAGYGVLLFDYRGYGGNPGSPSEPGLALDARAARAFVAATAPDHPVVYFGESLGAAVAVELATAATPAALVLRSPFTSLPDAAGVHYPFLPVRLLLWDEYPSLGRIGEVGVPLLVIAGSSDATIPLAQSRKLYDAADGPKEWLVIDGADHNDPDLTSGRELVDATIRFVAEHAGP